MDLWQAFFSLLRIVGLIFSCFVLFVVALSIKINTAIAYLAGLIIEKLTGAKPKELLTAHSQRYETKSIRYHHSDYFMSHSFFPFPETLSWSAL